MQGLWGLRGPGWGSDGVQFYNFGIQRPGKNGHSFALTMVAVTLISKPTELEGLRGPGWGSDGFRVGKFGWSPLGKTPQFGLNTVPNSAYKGPVKKNGHKFALNMWDLQ